MSFMLSVSIVGKFVLYRAVTMVTLLIHEEDKVVVLTSSLLHFKQGHVLCRLIKCRGLCVRRKPRVQQITFNFNVCRAGI